MLWFGFSGSTPYKVIWNIWIQSKKPLFVLAKDYKQEKKENSSLSKVETDILPEEKIGMVL